METLKSTIAFVALAAITVIFFVSIARPQECVQAHYVPVNGHYVFEGCLP